MSHPAYIREKAVQLRTERGMTIDEITERLAVSRTTIYYWVRDIPIERKPRQGFTEAELERAAEAISARARIHREAAYRLGAKEFPDLSQESSFRDFVCIYITNSGRLGGRNWRSRYGVLTVRVGDT